MKKLFLILVIIFISSFVFANASNDSAESEAKQALEEYRQKYIPLFEKKDVSVWSTELRKDTEGNYFITVVCTPIFSGSFPAIFKGLDVVSVVKMKNPNKHELTDKIIKKEKIFEHITAVIRTDDSKLADKLKINDFKFFITAEADMEWDMKTIEAKGFALYGTNNSKVDIFCTLCIVKKEEDGDWVIDENYSMCYWEDPGE